MIFKKQSILLTRAPESSQSLVAKLNDQDFNVIQFPTVTIAPPPDLSPLLSANELLTSYDYVIFTSVNAVIGWQNTLTVKAYRTCNRVNYASVGPATTFALQQLGLHVYVTPHRGEGSEALLRHPDLQVVLGKKILIVSGVGGRELLENELICRGAEVIKVASYQRLCPKVDSTKVARKVSRRKVALAICHSVTALQNLLRLLNEAGAKHIMNLPLVVVSDRIRDEARDLGWTAPIIVSRNAGDNAVMESIKEWREECQYE